MADADKTVVIKATLNTAGVDKGAKDAKRSLSDIINANKGAVLAVVAATAALYKKIMDAVTAFDKMKRDNVFHNLKAGADQLAQSIGNVITKLERQQNLTKALSDVETGKRDMETQLKLAENEKARQTELSGVTDNLQKARINAKYDIQAAQIERSGLDNGSKARQATIDANEAKIGELNEAIDALSQRLSEVGAKGGSAAQSVQELTTTTGVEFIDNIISDIFRSGKIKNATDDAQRYSELQKSIAEEIKARTREVQSLQDANKVLEAEKVTEGTATTIADVTLEAKNQQIANNLAEAEAQAIGKAAETRSPEVEPQIQSDRLARIGGFVGGAATPMKKSEDLLAKGNKQRDDLLAAIKTFNGGTFG